MIRTRQESVEHYEVTSDEIADALGLFREEGDEVKIVHAYGSIWKLSVHNHVDEVVEMEAPVRVEAAIVSLLDGLAFLPLGPDDADDDEIPGQLVLPLDEEDDLEASAA